MRKLILISGLTVIIIFGWHLVKTRELVADLEPKDLPYLSVQANPVTNVVRFHFDMGDEIDSDMRIAAHFGYQIVSQGREEFEAEFALIAREQVNLYAMLIPYRVRVTSNQ
jgi:hypothetical protein